MSKPKKAPTRRWVYPPRGLQLSLLAQVPGVVLSWPLHPPLAAIVAATLMVLLAALLNLGAIAQFRRHGVGIVPFSPASELAQSGPYRFTRNPMYLGMVLISAALAIGTGTWPNLAIALGYGLWLHFAFILPEERFLRDRFGAAFDTYAKQRPRWLIL